MSGRSGQVLLERYGVEHMRAIASKAGQKAKANGSAYFSAMAKNKIKSCPDTFRAALTDMRAWHHAEGLDIDGILDSSHPDHVTFIGRLRATNRYKWNWKTIGKLLQRAESTPRKTYADHRRMNSDKLRSTNDQR